MLDCPWLAPLSKPPPTDGFGNIKVFPILSIAVIFYLMLEHLPQLTWETTDIFLRIAPKGAVAISGWQNVYCSLVIWRTNVKSWRVIVWESHDFGDPHDSQWSDVSHAVLHCSYSQNDNNISEAETIRINTHKYLMLKNHLYHWLKASV